VNEGQSALADEVARLVAATDPTIHELLEVVRGAGFGDAQLDPERGVPVRVLGQAYGNLLAPGLRPDVQVRIAASLGLVLQAERATAERTYEQRAGRAVRELFEQGARAADVATVGRLLARVVAEVFGTDRVALHLTDGRGRVAQVFGVGVDAEMTAALRLSLAGADPSGSPVWSQATDQAAPVLADDVRTVAVRPGGFVETMQLRAFVALPLMSADGPVGMVVAGDVHHPRSWTTRDRALAAQLALEGGLVVDSARLRQHERAHVAELEHRAHHDDLTGLANRSRFLDRVGSALADGGPAGALLLVDLDGFKDVNDTHGHLVGDELLRVVARRLENAVRSGDLVARLGGDEFAVLLNTATAEEVQLTAERLARLVAEPVDVDGVTVRVHASVGMSVLDHTSRDVTALLRAADEAMYCAKRAGDGPRWAPEFRRLQV